jgi:hypothetical protein
VTAAVARLATDRDHPLMESYARHCHDLIAAGVLSDRAAETGCGWPGSSLIRIRIWMRG